MTKLEICHELIQQQIAKIESRWDPDDPVRTQYLIHIKEYDNDHIIIQPKYHDVFYEMDLFIQIVLGCQLQSYVTVEPNLDGNLTPTLFVF